MGLNCEFPVYSRNGLTIARGEGHWVYDDQGRRFLDFYGGHAVANLGHAHPALTRAIVGQTEKLLFQTNAVELDVRREACTALASIAPEGLDCALLLNTGAEANENALRMAFFRAGRSKVVALQGAFHGRSAAAAAVTDHAVWYGFPRAPFEVVRVPVNDGKALDAAMDDETAAFIFEPVQGVGGAVALSDEFAGIARRLCTQRGVTMIADEVQTGMGRTGNFFAVQDMGVVPDLLTVAKGIAGGFPAAALLAPSAEAAKVAKGWMGTTFGGGPVASAAIVATVAAISEEGFLARVRESSRRIRSEAIVGPVTAISGKGLLLGLHCSRPAKEVQSELLAKCILAGDAKDPSVVRLLPPLNIDDEAIDLLIQALKEISA